jgi:hypothetical protein
MIERETWATIEIVMMPTPVMCSVFPIRVDLLSFSNGFDRALKSGAMRFCGRER